jgi:hypothetical protein
MKPDDRMLDEHLDRFSTAARATELETPAWVSSVAANRIIHD